MNRALFLTIVLFSVTYTLDCGGQPEVAGQSSPVDTASQPIDKEEREPFADGEKVFRAVKDSLLKKYYRAGVSENDLYRAAIEGMLHNVDPKLSAWNKLLSPREVQELRADLRGEVLGVGVEIKFEEDSGISTVLGVIPGSPAQKGGVQAGDKIVSVNGKLYKGKTLRDVVAEIRGRAGDIVKLTLLRADRLIVKELRREAIVYEVVERMLLPDQIGYLFVGSFNETTPQLIEKALLQFKQQGVRGLLVDLRGNQGGLLDKAVESADLLLPRGQVIARVKKRNEKEEAFVSKKGPVLSGVKMAVLVDGETSSGAELFAAALSEGLKVQVVGQKTFGKWNVQTIEELPNRYAVKYTVSLFFSPSGKSLSGQGLLPDVEVVMADELLDKVQRIKEPNERLAKDVQLRTAHNIIRLLAAQPR